MSMFRRSIPGHAPSTRVLRWLPSLLAMFLGSSGFAITAPTAPPIASIGTPASQFAASSTLSGFTVPAGTNRVLVVTASDPASASTPISVTFNGTNMTLVTSVSDSNVAVDSIWVLPMGSSGSSTTANIVVAFGGTQSRFIAASVYENVHQTTPASAGPTNNVTTGSNLGSSVNVSSATSELVYDVFDTFNSSAAATIGVGAGQTSIHDRSGAVPSGFAHYMTSTEAGAFSVAMSWTSNATAILHATINLKLAPAAAPTPSITKTVTTVNTQSTFGLVLTANSAQVTHYKITGITNGTLYKNDGTTGISNNAFITLAEGTAGLKFTPSNDFTGSATFNAAGAFDGSGTGLGTTVAADILVASNLNAGDLVIREFRSRGPAGIQDEYVKITNKTGAALTVGATDGSSGFAIVGQNVGGTCPTGSTQVLATIDNGKVIPAGGFVLVANNTATTGYSLGNYGGAGAATPDATWTNDLCDGSGIGLFRSASTFDTTTRLDAAGFVGSTSPYIEGTGITVPASTGTSEVAFLREAPGGVVQDTGVNSADFFLGDTAGAAFAPVTARLAAPGPQNATSQVANGITLTFADPAKAATAFPNRYRTSATATTGTYFFRWKVTNNTGAAITKLRIRVSNVTTLNSPGYVAAGTQADFRLTNSSDVAITVPGAVTALGLTVEPPPTGLAQKGGYNASASVVLPGGTLANGASVYINLAFFYPQAGSYTYFVTGEAK